MPYMKGVAGAVAEDLSGRKFNRLTAIRRDFSRTRPAWLCVCECGKETIATITELKSGHSKSCGCLSTEALVKRNRTHGMTGTPTYISWFHMHDRCRNVKRKDYPRYGGRGILVCEAWSSFEAFLADMGEKPSGLTLDRIDVNGNYEPGNCRWATQHEQQRNRRNNRFVELHGELMTITEAARKLNKHHSSIAFAISKYGDNWPSRFLAACEQFDSSTPTGVAHEWECVSPGMYDSLYRCKKCGAEHMEQLDRLGSERPKLGCSGGEQFDAKGGEL